MIEESPLYSPSQVPKGTPPSLSACVLELLRQLQEQGWTRGTELDVVAD